MTGVFDTPSVFLFENLGENLFLHDERGRILRASRHALENLGFEEEQMRNRCFWDLDPVRDRAFLTSLWERIPPGQHREVSGVLRRVDGSRIPVLHRTTAFEWGGETGYMTLSRRTHNPNKLTDLEESEEIYRATFEQGAIGMTHLTREGRFLRANRKLQEFLGYDENTLLEMSLQDVTHPEEIDQDLENIKRLWNGEISNYVREKRYIRRDGSVVWGRIGVALIRGEKGEPRYINGILQDITQQKKLEDRLREKSRTDGLTGLYTHSHFMKSLNERLEEARRYHRPLSVLMLDLDNFKGINDRYGHPAGDKVLRRFSRKLREVVRQHDLPGRYGGEEFAVLLPETARDEALTLGERIRETTESMQFFDEGISITLSGGAASYPDDAEESQQLIDQADAALYRAKKQGRNRICSPPS